MKIGVRRMILIALFAALTAVGAFIRIPLGPLPFTLQVFFCLLAGMLLGPLDGALAQVLYLVIGLAGVPVFSQGGGPGYVLMPSFGYLLGLIPCAYLAGLIARRQDARMPRMLAAAGLGILTLYLCGVPYLYFMFNTVMGEMAFSQALWGGMAVFLPMDILKGLLAAAVTLMVRRRLPAAETDGKRRNGA